MARRLMKVGVKASILTGAVYYTIDQGLWEDTEKADKVYAELYQAIIPYVKEVAVEVPDLPSTSDLAASTKFFYNQGIISTGNFLKDLPSNASSLAGEIKSSLAGLLEPSTAEVQGSSSETATTKS